MMTPNVDQLLDKISEYFKRNKGIDLNEIKIIQLIKSQQKKWLNEFNKLSFNLNDIEDLVYNIKFLEQEKLVLRDPERPNIYILSLKSLLYYKYKIPYQNRILDDLNEEFFLKPFKVKEIPLNGDEKAIILALLGLLALDNNSSVKITPGTASEAFKESVEEAASYLKSHSYGDKTLENIWSSQIKGEEPVFSKMRRMNDIGKKTNNIYVKDENGHYLNILNGDNLDNDKLNLLLKKIFNKDVLSYEERSELLKLLDKIYEKRTKIIKSNQTALNILLIRLKLKEMIKEWT